MKTVKIGIASYEKQKARLLAAAKGDYRVKSSDPKIWFTSIESVAQVLSTKNQLLLEIIAQAKPTSLGQLAEMSGRAESNLSRTLKRMAQIGLIALHKEGKSLIPVALYDRIEIDLPLGASARAPAFHFTP